MMNPQRPPFRVSTREVVVALAGALAGISLLILVFGAYYEGHDDHHLTLMLRRLVVGRHTTDIRPYVPGISYVLTWLYAHAGRVPWYGLYHYLLLTIGYALLILTVVGATRQRPAPERLGALGLLGVLIFAENAIIFNFTRPSFLLGAGAVLLYGMVAGARRASWAAVALCFGAVGLGITQRPESVVLGLVVGLPMAIALARHQLGASGPEQEPPISARFLAAGRYFLPLGLWAGLGLATLSLGLSPAQQEYRRERTLVYSYLDYHLFRFSPRDAADSVQVKLLDYSFFADAQALADGALHHTVQFKAAEYARQRLTGKARDLLYVLRTRFWPYLLLLVVNVMAAWRFGPARRRWLRLGAVLLPWGMMLGVAVVLKAPDRVISPLMQVSTLGAALLIAHDRNPMATRRGWRLYLGALGGLALLTLLQVHQLRLRYRQQREHAEEAIAFIQGHYQHRKLVLSQAFSRIDGLSPLRVYDFGTNQLIPLTDWNTLDPTYQDFLRETTGRSTWIGAVEALARDPSTRWLLPADFKSLLDQYIAARYGRRLPLVALPSDDVRPLRRLTRVDVDSYAPAGAGGAAE